MAKNIVYSLGAFTIRRAPKKVIAKDAIPIKLSAGNTKFGKVYEGKHKLWTFIFYTDQNDVYADTDGQTGAVEKDLDLIPIVSFCKETATFPQNAFLTQDDDTRNTFVLKVKSDEEEVQYRDIVNEVLSEYEN